MKIWLADDYSYGRVLIVDGTCTDPVEVANKYGQGSTGEIVHIWNDENHSRLPDQTVYWDAKKKKYRTYKIEGA